MAADSNSLGYSPMHIHKLFVQRLSRAASALALALVAACATVQQEPAPDYQAIVSSPDRTDGDRGLDQRRRPEKLLEFYDVRKGMRVLDMGASHGYNTELLARAVGPDGLVAYERVRWKVFHKRFVRFG